MLEKIWSWIEKNRFTVIAPIIAVIVWIVAVGCTPETISPFHQDKSVTAAELEDDYVVWQKENEVILAKFEAAGKDLQRQYEDQQKLLDVVTALASGSVADWPGMVQLLVGSGVLGLLFDNQRKNAVISGLKIVKKPK